MVNLEARFSISEILLWHVIDVNYLIQRLNSKLKNKLGREFTVTAIQFCSSEDKAGNLKLTGKVFSKQKQ